MGKQSTRGKRNTVRLIQKLRHSRGRRPSRRRDNSRHRVAKVGIRWPFSGVPAATNRSRELADLLTSNFYSFERNDSIIDVPK